MDYQLVKKMQEAGFKLTTLEEVDAEQAYIYDGEGHGYRKPTLSELIKACGDVNDFSLQKLRDEWWAGSSDTDRISEETVPSGRGATPEAAVARLWLALKTQPAAQ